MSVRQAVAATGLLLLVGAAWWLLAEFASAPSVPAPSGAALEGAVAPLEPLDGKSEGEYPPDYVDDLPLTDAPSLPEAVTKEYVPAFERPDLIGDGMLVPLEIELGEPQLPATSP